MAQKFTYNVGSEAPTRAYYDYDTCGVCAGRRSLRWAFQSNYETGLIISQRGFEDINEHDEVLVCDKCEPKFHPDTLLEV
jgi:hypothetical protein